MILMDNSTIQPLIKAFENLEDMRSADHSEHSERAITQALEECFDLMIGVLKTLLEEKGQIAQTPADILTLSAIEGFIREEETWLSFLQKRIITDSLSLITQEQNRESLRLQPLLSIEIHHFLNQIWVRC